MIQSIKHRGGEIFIVGESQFTAMVNGKTKKFTNLRVAKRWVWYESMVMGKK
jgi:hypothetical protein